MNNPAPPPSPAPPVPARPALIQNLLHSDAWPHPVDDITVIETHISWLLLTGKLAYKLKKPLDLGFLNFSTLALRRQACENELRLNRRLAGAVYQAVVAITGSAEQPQVGGNGEVIEYAVRMQQFDPGQGFSELLRQQRLEQRHLDRLAAIIAEFHQHIPRASSDQPWGDPQGVIAPMQDNFAPIARLLDAQQAESLLQPLQQWLDTAAQDQYEALVERKRNGFVRECHGDLHLDNVVLWQGEPLVFDCIEFSPELRWSDVISELAFTSMDLAHRGYPGLANRFINHYLEHSGDYPGLVLLPLYQFYRAMVRAKIEAIVAEQRPRERATHLQQMQAYIVLAGSYTRPGKPCLIITHGLSGSGKTTWTTELLGHLERTIRIRSDVERKRLFGMQALERGGAEGADKALYSAAANTATYQRLHELAALLLAQDYTVIVEATFLWHTGREQFRQLAARQQAAFLILDFRADTDVLRQRIHQRNATGNDASDADLAVLALQLSRQQALHADELADVIGIDTEDHPDIAKIAGQIQSAYHHNP